jgi:hypothetical protein
LRRPASLFGRWQRLAATAIVSTSICYGLWYLPVGWISYDEGQLGHTAERILEGELPHRDFDEPYTGGLGLMNAFAFKLLGIRVESLRWCLLPFFFAFSWTCYGIARRVVSPVYAAVATSLCVFFSLPMYPAGMPSWYNLFFATYGVLALLRHIETRRVRWLVLAGFFGGCSVLIKITGLYFVAAGLLFLVFREQNQSCTAVSGGRGFSWLSTLFLIAFGFLVVLFVPGSNPVMAAVHFGLPLVGLAATLVWNEWAFPHGRFEIRLRRLCRLVVPFLLGATAAVGPFVAFYIVYGAGVDLWRGLFVTPTSRLQFATWPLPGINWFIMGLPLAALFVAGFRRRIRLRPMHWAMFYGSLILLFVGACTRERAFFAVFQSLRNQIPVVIGCVLALIILATIRRDLSRLRRERLMVVGAVAAMIGLVQFPYAFGIYFFYAAPMAVLAALYLIAYQPSAPKLMHMSVAVFFLVFAMLLHHSAPSQLAYDPRLERDELRLARCGLMVNKADAELFNELIPDVQRRSSNGSFIYAAPDCPEIYFLSGRKNPTRKLYDFFERANEGGNRDLLALLGRRQVKVVVINESPGFSPPLDADFVSEIEREFRHQAVYGEYFADGQMSRPRFRMLWRD